MQKFQSVVTDLTAYAVVIDMINAEQFDALVTTNIPQFVIADLIALQSFGYSVSLVRNENVYRIMIEKV